MKLEYFSILLGRFDIRLCVTLMTVCMFTITDILIGYFRHGAPKKVESAKIVRRYE